ncbi:RHS repeat-associated core domain-containing protein [Kutzneria buriramensis]|uniref:RHS repeat-associated protein n=1 Tax=Kutzneria buriramensis TaxID=1045776 RepID=A0A3E0HF65_9PSEU|nr:RHS repeat-associated core domain-containing protein [Kutzneria buriramensis]REH43837.1 RHS repeat-associated protein [Kutzneria buriramensis]
MSKIDTNPDHLRRSGGKLSEFGEKIAQGGQKLETAGQDLVQHASGDRSGVGAVVAKAMGRGVEITGKVFKEGGRVAGKAGENLGKTGDLHEEADLKGRDGLLRHHPEDRTKKLPGSGGEEAPKSVGAGGKGGKDKEPAKLPGAGGDATPKTVGAGGGGKDKAPPNIPPTGKNRPRQPTDNSLPGGKKKCLTDPVDAATGTVIIRQRDVTLPDLVFERTYLSSYTAGGWFGPSWPSTVDQRVEVDRDGVCYFAPDGMILCYPHPAPGADVVPISGPRWPLATDTGEGDYRITVPETGRQLHFTGPMDAGVVRIGAVTDNDGNRIDFDYFDGVPVGIRHSAGYRIGLRVEESRVTELHVLGDDMDVLVMRYGYDDRGRLTTLTNSSGQSTRFAYADGRLSGWDDRNGTWYRYVYDADGRCAQTVGSGGFLDSRFQYGERSTTFTDALGHSTTYEFTDAGQVARETDQLGRTTTFDWDRHHRLLSRTDPLGRTTRFEYGNDDDPTAVIRPDGSRVTLTREADGGLTIEVDGWRRTYEPGAAPDPLTDPIGVGGVKELAATPAAGPPNRSTVDLFGRPMFTSDRRTRFGWTVEGKPAWRAGPAGGERWSYDGEGNELEHVDVLGRVTRREYGPFDQLTAEVDETGARTTFKYDNELRLSEVTGPHGRTWRYHHDAAGRLLHETDFDGRRFQYDYDAAGQLIRSVNGADEVVEYGYDALGAVVERRTPTETTRYRYDPVGRLVEAASDDAVVRVERDDQGRVVAHTVNDRTVSFAYDPEDRWIRRQTPAGVASEWTFDADGNPTTLTTSEHTTAFAYDSGRETTRIVDDTVTVRQSYDADHRLTGQAVEVANRPVHARAYDYRADGKLVGTRDAAGPTRYDLDAAGRVTEVAAPDHVERYRYDIAGDLIDANGVTLRYNGNTLVSAGDEQFEHDAQGRLVTRRRGADTWRYTWDALDRMTGVTTPAGTTWTYRYDPLGRRIAKEGPDERVEFVWDGTVLVEQTRIDATGRRVTTWHHHPDDDRPVIQQEQDRSYTIVADHIGSPTRLVDENGLAWQATTTLWGAGPQGPTPLRFPGQYRDDETGLHYNVFRYYDPTTGRYLSQDPLGLEPAPNPAAYVANPLAATDPLGLTPDEGCGTGDAAQTGKKRPRPADDADNAAATGSNKKPKTYKAGDIVNDDLQHDAVTKHKENLADPEATSKDKKNSSEAMGEAGAVDYLKKTTGNDDIGMTTASRTNPLDPEKYKMEAGKPWPDAVAFNGANVSDVVHWDGKNLHVVEAKGGTSELTGGDVDGRVQKYDHTTGELRPYKDRVDNPMRMDQGSQRYLTDVAHSMTHSKIPDGRNHIGQTILDAQANGTVKYTPVGTAINPQDHAVVKVKHGYGEQH